MHKKLLKESEEFNKNLQKRKDYFFNRKIGNLYKFMSIEDALFLISKEIIVFNDIKKFVTKLDYDDIFNELEIPYSEYGHICFYKKSEYDFYCEDINDSIRIEFNWDKTVGNRFLSIDLESIINDYENKEIYDSLLYFPRRDEFFEMFLIDWRFFNGTYKINSREIIKNVQIHNYNELFDNFMKNKGSIISNELMKCINDESVIHMIKDVNEKLRRVHRRETIDEFFQLFCKHHQIEFAK